MVNASIRYLVIPGWQGSPHDHWQSHWQRTLPNAVRVEQADWQWPRRSAWVAELERSIAAEPTAVVLIAHSLGCVTVAHWAAQASPALLAQVRGALLVAPADVERPGCPEELQDFAPMPTAPLPFPAQIVGSDNDHAASAARLLELSRDWQAPAGILPGAGHINVKSGHHRWEQGFAWLYRLQARIDRQQRRSA
jgi:hypothetical protein